MKPWKAGSLPLILVLISGLFLAACQSAPQIPITYRAEDLRFEGPRAHELEEEFVIRFPNRDSGMPNNRLAAEWVSNRFSDLGFACQMDEWTVINYSRETPLVNTVCRLPGDSSQELIVVAHRDQAPMTVEGAEDNASGIAVMLHLAEVLSMEQPLPYSLLFVSTDGEEYGMLGARRLMQTHPDTSQIIAGISIDSVGRDYYDHMFFEMIGQFRNYGPIWLALVTREASAAGEGTWRVALRAPLDQAIDQAAPFSFTDQGPMVAVGVPALSFAGGYDASIQSLHYDLWHTPEDTISYQSPEALGHAGRTTEALVRQLLSMQDFPRETGPYLYFDESSQVLRGAPLMLLFAGFVIIFFIASLLVGRSAFNPTIPNWRLVLPDFLGLWVPLILGVLLLYGLVEVGLMEEYHLYPATSKDPEIYNPRWPAILIFLAGLAVLFAAGRRLVKSRSAGLDIPGIPSRRSFGYLVVGLAGIYTLATNPFTLLFYIPLLPWLLIRGRTGAARLVDLVLFAIGGLAVYYMVFQFGFVVYDYGLGFLWFMLMMFASGMINFPTLAVASAIIAAGLVMVVTPARPPAAPQPRVAPSST